MSVFKKFLASVGIGAAKVDTRIYEDFVVPGGAMSGEVSVTGGEISQDIDEIYLYLATRYKRETSDRTYYEECKLLTHRLYDPFTLQPHENKIVPFSLNIPYETPLTYFKTEVYVRTGLNIAMAINPRDWDHLHVHPTPWMQKVLDAVSHLGFQLYQVDCEYNPNLGRNFPFIQDFEFRAMGQYRGRLDELEVIFYQQPNRLEVLLQIDPRVRGWKSFVEEVFNVDERYAHFYVTSEDLENTTIDLAKKIDEIIQNRLG